MRCRRCASRARRCCPGCADVSDAGGRLAAWSALPPSTGSRSPTSAHGPERRVGPAVVLLHGWPGDRQDWRAVVPLLAAEGRATVVVPDLRGFGASDKHPSPTREATPPPGRRRACSGSCASSICGPAVVAGYDVGSRVAQQLARSAPDAVRALVIAPPLPGRRRARAVRGRGARVLVPELSPARAGRATARRRSPAAVRAYLEHFWSHWSGPGYTPEPARARPAGRGLRRARRVHGVDRLVPGRIRARWPAAWPSRRRRPRTGSPCPPPCCGPARSAVPGRVERPHRRVLQRGRRCGRCPTPATSRRSRPRRSSPRRSRGRWRRG